MTEQICPNDEYCNLKKVVEGPGKYCTKNKQNSCKALSYYNNHKDLIQTGIERFTQKAKNALDQGYEWPLGIGAIVLPGNKLEGELTWQK